MTWHRAKIVFNGEKQTEYIKVGSKFKDMVRLKEENKRLKGLLKNVDELFDMIHDNDPVYVDTELWNKIKMELEK